MGRDFVAVGEAFVDVGTDRLEAAARLHAPVRLRAGGTAVHAGVAAAAVGGRAAVVARVGGDAAGELVRLTLERAGVEPLLTVDEILPTGSMVAVAGGSGGIVADRGASAALTVGDVPEELDAPAVLVSRYALLNADTRPAAHAALARASGPWIAVGAVPADAAGSWATAIFANEDEASALTGLPPESALAELARRYRLVCVTLGPSGAIATCDGSVARARVEPVDGGEPGSGDVFAATVLVSLVKGFTLADALAEGARAGARVAVRDRTSA